MDKIILEGMSFFAYHGLKDSERRDGQNFEVDMEIWADLKRAGQSDDIQDTVDFEDIFSITEEIVSKKRFNLLEALAEALAVELLNNHLIEEIVIRVKKTEPPIAGKIKGTAVEVRRTRR